MKIRILAEEYADRLDRLKTAMRNVDLDVFIVSSFDNIYYLTGAGFEPLERPFFMIVYPDRDTELLVPLLDFEHMKKARNVSVDRMHSYREFPAPEEESWPVHLRELLGSAQRIGVEPSIPQSVLQELKEYSPASLPLVDQLRLIKSPMEVSMIRRAAAYADLGVRKLLQASYYGATICEGFAQTGRVSAQIIREVKDWEPLTTKVLMATWAAPRSAHPHGVPALGDLLCAGPHVALVLTRVNGYAAESERTYFTTSPTDTEKDMFNAMQEARRQAIELIRPGVTCHEIDHSVNEMLSSAGYSTPQERLHRTGHGIGLGNHEGPWIAEGSPDVLKENMVVSVEPGIYKEGIGGVRHSDTVLVTERGPELLTCHPSDLQTLTLSRCKPVARLKGRLTRKLLDVRRSSCTARV